LVLAFEPYFNFFKIKNIFRLDEGDNLYNNYYQHDTREDYQTTSNQNKPHHNFSSPTSNSYQPAPSHGYMATYTNTNTSTYAPPQIMQTNQYYKPAMSTKEPIIETQPMMLSFNQYMSSINQNLSQDQANKSYNNYKNNFHKKQIQLFFDEHKNEDWY
jgi:hypothetical protein